MANLMTVTESKFTAWYCSELTKVNCECMSFVGDSARQEAGVPDRYVCGTRLPGLWLEFKGLRTPVSPHQTIWMEKRLRHRVPCLVVRLREWNPRSINYVDPRGGILCRYDFSKTVRIGNELRRQLVDAVECLNISAWDK